MVSDAHIKANARYLEKLDDIKIRVPAGDREKYKDLAARRGQSLNAFVVSLLEKEMQLCPPPPDKE